MVGGRACLENYQNFGLWYSKLLVMQPLSVTVPSVVSHEAKNEDERRTERYDELYKDGKRTENKDR